jgi:hypothetical protein
MLKLSLQWPAKTLSVLHIASKPFLRGVLFLLLGLLGMGLYGQKVKLSGVVRDSVTQELLPLVGVVLDGTTYWGQYQLGW